MERRTTASTEKPKRRLKGIDLLALTATVLWSAMTATQAKALSLRDVVARPSLDGGDPGTITSERGRRDFVGTVSAFVVAAPLCWDPTEASAAQDAKERFVAARKELRDLIDNYSEITAKGGGDAVRNRLGTQGVNSDLFGVQKVLKNLANDAEDLVDYTETMEEFNAYYFQAEGAAYQSMFVEHSSAKGTPETFLKTAKDDILQMEKYMDQLAVQLNL